MDIRTKLFTEEKLYVENGEFFIRLRLRLCNRLRNQRGNRLYNRCDYTYLNSNCISSLVGFYIGRILTRVQRPKFINNQIPTTDFT